MPRVPESSGWNCVATTHPFSIDDTNCTAWLVAAIPSPFEKAYNDVMNQIDNDQSQSAISKTNKNQKQGVKGEDNHTKNVKGKKEVRGGRADTNKNKKRDEEEER